MQRLSQVAQQARFAAMLPAAITERQALDAALAATPYIGEQIVLQPAPQKVRVEFWNIGNAINVRDEDYRTVAHVQRDHDSDEPWRWYGSVRLTDQLGREWVRRVAMVTDDFGDLVEVAS